MKSRTTSEWLELFEANDIPATPLNDVKSLLDDSHLSDTGFFRIVDHPTEGALRTMQIPGAWSASPPDIRRLAPSLGEHTVEVLREAGLAEQTIDRLSSSAGQH